MTFETMWGKGALRTVVVVAVAALFFALSNNLSVLLWINDFVDSFSTASFGQDALYSNHMSGNFAPVDNEHFNMKMNLVSGKMPHGLSGLFLQIGPNPILRHSKAKILHRFDGHGMIHSVRIRDLNNLEYSNQFVRTPRYLTETKQGRSIFFNLGEYRGIVGVLKKLLLHPLLLKYFSLTDLTVGPANMNVVIMGHGMYVCHENSLPFAIRWNENNSFTSLGYQLISPANSFSTPMTAHPKVDVASQILYYTGQPQSPNGPSLIYGKVFGSSSLQMIDQINVELPTRPWVHDMQITQNYILLLCGSIIRPGDDIPSGEFAKFNKNVHLEIGVASKDDAEFVVGDRPKTPGIDSFKHSNANSLQWFRAPSPAGIMFTANAWEEDDNTIILWAPMCEDDFDSTFSKGTNSFYMTRVVLNLLSGHIRRGVLKTEYRINYPKVHPGFQGFRSQYAYACILKHGTDEEVVGIVKFNLFSKIVDSTIYFPGGLIGNEMVPVPKQSVVNSDFSDGSDALYLALFMFNMTSNSSEWWLFDGESMFSDPVVRYSLPVRVPHGFRSFWIGNELLNGIINAY